MTWTITESRGLMVQWEEHGTEDQKRVADGGRAIPRWIACLKHVTSLYNIDLLPQRMFYLFIIIIVIFFK